MIHGQIVFMLGDALDAWAAELRLSSRQAEVLRLLISGSSNLEIPGVLGVTLGTAKQHVRAVYAAVGGLVAYRAGDRSGETGSEVCVKSITLGGCFLWTVLI
jgi:hypothetical protein